MKFRVEEEMYNLYPGLRIGVIRGRGLDNSSSPSELKSRIRDVQNRVCEGMDLKSLGEHSNIKAWRQAYRLFGAKPKKHLSSVESLYRMTLEGRSLRSINPLVDIYNSASLEFGFPIGGDDLSRVDGDIRLGLARGDEPFRPLNAESTEFPRPGEVVYADDSGILCRRWNWRESDRSKMTGETTDVVLFVESLPPSSRKDLESCLSGLESLIGDYCGGTLTGSLVESSSDVLVL